MTTIPSCGLDPQLELPSDYLVQEDWWSCNYTICQDPKIRPYTPSVLFSVLLLVLIPALLVVIPKQRGHKVSRSDFFVCITGSSLFLLFGSQKRSVFSVNLPSST